LAIPALTSSSQAPPGAQEKGGAEPIFVTLPWGWHGMAKTQLLGSLFMLFPSQGLLRGLDFLRFSMDDPKFIPVR